jgi:bacteriocin biosynthesis cyclodehydratase domain-containing protein
VRSGVPHLLLRLSEGHAWLGPFVDPGRTACLRCVDAHHTDVDPPWPLLVEQHAARGGRDRVDGVPEPVDGLLATIVLAWAVRDLASFAEGSRPSTWSTSIRLDPHLSAIESRTWLRHPACGCGWQETALPG